MTPSTTDTHEQIPAIGVIGGSGFYTWLDDATPVEVSTPFGEPSQTPVVGTVAGRPVAFLPRHGHDHRFPPHHVNYRANLWALRSLGVRQVLGPCAVGSMRPELGPGSLVIPHQLIDRTWGRAHTVYDGAAGHVQDGRSPHAIHVAFADPYCPRGRRAALDAADGAGWPARDGSTMVVVNGPRFSSRAESVWHASTGAELVGMTGLPEASIARELALCYTSLAIVTDLDAGIEHGDGVTHAEVMEVFAHSIESLKVVLTATVAALPADDDCVCRHAVDGLPLPFDLP